MFVVVNPSGNRMYIDSLWIAVPVRINAWHCSGSIYKWIIGWYATVVEYPVNLATMVSQCLSIRRFSTLTNSKIKVPLIIENHAAAIMMRSGWVGHGLEDFLLVDQLIIPQFCPDNRCITTYSTWSFFRIRDINPAILLILRMQNNIKQSTLPLSKNFRNSGNNSL